MKRLKNEEILELRRDMSSYSSASQFLRYCISKYGLTRTDLKNLILGLSKRWSIQDMQILHAWDFNNTGAGYSDGYLDAKLSHLLTPSSAELPAEILRGFRKRE